MGDDRHTDVQPAPDLADVPMKPAPDPADVDQNTNAVGDRPADPPAEDLTLPTE